MDSVKLNKEGVAPIKADLEQIASLKDKEAVYALLADLRKQGIGAYLGLYVAADEMNSNENAVQLYQSGLSMGERDYYLATDPSTTAIRDAFRTHVQKMYQWQVSMRLLPRKVWKWLWTWKPVLLKLSVLVPNCVTRMLTTIR